MCVCVCVCTRTRRSVTVSPLLTVAGPMRPIYALTVGVALQNPHEKREKVKKEEKKKEILTPVAEG